LADRLQPGDPGQRPDAGGSPGPHSSMGADAGAGIFRTKGRPKSVSRLVRRAGRAVRCCRCRRAGAVDRGRGGRGGARLPGGAAASMAADEPPDCQAMWMAEMRAALDLAPMSSATYGEAGRLLSRAWLILDEAGRAEATPILERAREMNPSDQELHAGLAALG